MASVHDDVDEIEYEGLPSNAGFAVNMLAGALVRAQKCSQAVARADPDAWHCYRLASPNTQSCSPSTA